MDDSRHRGGNADTRHRHRGQWPNFDVHPATAVHRPQKDLYGLYIMAADKTGPARKLVEADYLTELQWRPGSETWTFRGDLGDGVQLYSVDKTGRTQALVENPQLARVGGDDSLVMSSYGYPRMTGVLSNDVERRKCRDDLRAIVDGCHYSSCLTHSETFPPQRTTTTVLPA